jgi:hypothetical protein
MRFDQTPRVQLNCSDTDGNNPHPSPSIPFLTRRVVFKSAYSSLPPAQSQVNPRLRCYRRRAQGLRWRFHYSIDPVAGNSSLWALYYSKAADSDIRIFLNAVTQWKQICLNA